ncbi:MAG: hypothetical protein AAGJ55_09550 [Cyanobacteria bacterium J06555_12]
MLCTTKVGERAVYWLGYRLAAILLTGGEYLLQDGEIWLRIIARERGVRTHTTLCARTVRKEEGWQCCQGLNLGG